MSDQGPRFQHRWNFRRTETDVDSSSDDDDNSRSDSASEPKLMKHNPVNCQFSEDAHQTMVSPASFPKEEKENNSSFEEPNRNPNQSKARSRTKRTTSNHEPSDASFIDLRGYMESMVEEIKTARKDLLVWMSNEMTSSFKDDVISPKPRKGQRQSAKRSKTPRNNNPNKGRRRSGKVTQNQNQTNEEVVPPKEGENVVIDAKPVEKTGKQKGKTSRLSTKKRKVDATEAVGQQTDKTVAAADSVTLSTVLPQKEVLNSDKNPSEDDVKRNALNSGVNMSSNHLKFDPRTQQKKDGVFVQNPVEDGNGRDDVKRNALNSGVNLSSDHLNFDLRSQQKKDGNGRGAVKRNALNSGVNLSSDHLNFDLRSQQKDEVFAQNPSKDGNGRDAVKRNALNPEFNLSSHHLNFNLRNQQKDGVFAQNPVDDGNRRDSLNSGVNLSSHHLNFDLRSQQKDEVFSQNPSEDGNERDVVKRNALNPEFNLSSHHLNFDLRNQQKDAVFAQNGLRNPNDYGNGFFPFVPQRSDFGIGMPNISSQFGQPYLTQANRMTGMFMEPPLFLNGNHAFKESYGVLNQPLKFNNVQQGGLQSPNIRRGAFNQQQGTKTNQ